jgi:ABC-type branched-subunit amino acid transport system substrate-binding protein
VKLLVLTAALLLPAIAVVSSMSTSAQGDVEPLKVGVLMPFTGDLSDFGPGLFAAAELAAIQINEAGGVNGQPIEVVQGDDGTAPQQAVEEARRLVEIEGVSAIIGPAGTPMTIQVAESVTGPGNILHITPSSTSPAISTIQDNDFLFRTTISDAAQGAVLADLAIEEGFQSACVMYINQAYGQGLADAFAAGFTAQGGTVTAMVPHESLQGTYATELEQCTEGSPDVMVSAAYPESAGVYLREAFEAGTVENFLFSDGTRSPDMFAELGWDNFVGMAGTSAGNTETAVGPEFDAAFEEHFGSSPSLPYLRESYDAMYLIALAAEIADSVDPTAMRDVLRDISNAPGEVVSPGVEGWQAALELIEAGEEIDYEGAAGSLGLDENGDVLQGTIVIWRVEGADLIIENAIPVDLSTMATPEAGTPEAA